MPKTNTKPSATNPAIIVNHGLRIFIPRHRLPLPTHANTTTSIPSSTSESAVPATVAFNHAACCTPGISMQPMPLAKFCPMAQSPHCPSRTARPKGWKIGEHQDTNGVGRWLAEEAWERPRIWRMRTARRRRKAVVKVRRGLDLKRGG